MSRGNLDETDIKIMSIMQDNARIDVTRIARRVNKTPHPIHDRIYRLEQDGYIKGYYTLLDRAKIGKPVLVITMVKLEKQTKKLLEEFERTANTMNEIQFCLHVSGKWDFILHITAETPQDYYLFLMEKICGQANVAHAESAFCLKECKSFGSFDLINK